MPRILKPAFFCLAALGLAACETPAEKQQRLTQHNGKTVEQVIASLGTPVSRTPTQAVWERRNSYVVRHPEYERIGGVMLLVGYDNQIVDQKCLFVADLQNNRVVSSTLSGTGCYKMLPPPGR
ncbi:hypothetical protein [Neptunicoccus sediminis]|uniref:hypothetical protein n=1 Tax=Neptunicoccus sediminis TaxID=1892596 RepID=UPI000845FA1A|nr:hypothetical protein [Neptunicoccus sediminis]